MLISIHSITCFSHRNRSQGLLYQQFSIHPKQLRVGAFLFSPSPNLPLPLSYHQFSIHPNVIYDSVDL